MNFRRGFFRLWVLGSALFAAGVAVVSYDDVAQEFKRAKESREWKEVALILIPVHCKDARGQSGTDYEGREGPWSDFRPKGSVCTTWPTSGGSIQNITTSPTTS